MAPGFAGQTFSDNHLISGKMNFDCATVDDGDETPCTNDAGLSKFHFVSGKTHRLRFVNAGSESVMRVSIDEHVLTVIANDFTEIEPYDTPVITLGVGQRVDVLVKASGRANDAYWLRSNATSCSLANQPFAYAAVYYDDADIDSIPASTPWDVPDPGDCQNDDLSLTKPICRSSPSEPSWTQHMDINGTVNETGHFLWTFGVGPDPPRVSVQVFPTDKLAGRGGSGRLQCADALGIQWGQDRLRRRHEHPELRHQLVRPVHHQQPHAVVSPPTPPHSPVP